MSGIFPNLTAGGLLVDNGDGIALNPADVSNAYTPAAPYTMTCDNLALPDNCTARIFPSQINALASELLCLAEKMNPTGTWNCDSQCNLSNAFTEFFDGTSSQGIGTYAEVIAAALCANTAATATLVGCLGAIDTFGTITMPNPGEFLWTSNDGLTTQTWNADTFGDLVDNGDGSYTWTSADGATTFNITTGDVTNAAAAGTSTNGVPIAAGDPVIEFPNGETWTSVLRDECNNIVNPNVARVMTCEPLQGGFIQFVDSGNGCTPDTPPCVDVTWLTVNPSGVPFQWSTVSGIWIQLNEAVANAVNVAAGVTPVLNDVDIAAIAAGGIPFTLLDIPVPDLTNTSTCRTLAYSMEFRAGAESMQIGPDNWYSMTVSGIGDGSPTIHFSTRNESHTQGQRIGGWPIFQKQVGTLVPGATVSFPNMLIQLTPIITNPSVWDAFSGGNAVNAYLTTTVV